MMKTPGSISAAEKNAHPKGALPGFPGVKAEPVMAALKFDPSKSAVSLGNALSPDAKHGSFRLAAFDKNSIFALMSKNSPVIGPVKCSLNSKDYTFQLNIHIPPGRGIMEFDIIWYPRLETGQSVSSITLVASGKGEPCVKSFSLKWRGGYNEWLTAKPLFRLAELEGMTVVEIYATVEGNGKAVNGAVAGCVGPPWAPAQVEAPSRAAEKNKIDDCLASMKAAPESIMTDSRADFVAATVALAGKN